MKSPQVLAAALALGCAPGLASASSFYIGVLGGYSQIREAEFSREFSRPGDDEAIAQRVKPDFKGGDTLSVLFGRASEGNDTFRGRSELELGFQRGNVDSMTFRDRELDGNNDDSQVEDDDEDVEAVEGESATRNTVSGTTEATFGFFNAYGDFWIRENLALVAGFGFGLGEVRFDTLSAEGDNFGLLLDDSDFTYGYQLIGGVAWQLWDRVDLEASYRLRSWEDVSVTSTDGTKSRIRVPSHNLQAGLRFRF